MRALAIFTVSFSSCYARTENATDGEAIVDLRGGKVAQYVLGGEEALRRRGQAGQNHEEGGQVQRQVQTGG